MENSRDWKDFKISAGSYDLNKFLYGGYEKDIITTIYGPGGSGKTNFCVLAAVSQAKKGNKVVYIDTEGGFSPDRVKQVLEEKGKDKEEREKVLENILLLSPTSFEEQIDVFEKLNKLINKNVSLIIVDSMVMLYRLELGDAIQSKDDNQIRNVNRKMAEQLKQLNEIARKQNIPIIVTNQVYTEFLTDEEFKEGKEKRVAMVGGDLLKYWSKCIIELKNSKGKRKLILKKHRSMPEKEMEFEICDEGIRKRGWL
jgi:DNA repair protein RadB